MKYANMHLHSSYSDACFTPRELVVIGKALGYGALALTDHETDGGCKEFAEKCKAEGIECITGVEFYGKVQGCVPHLTALDFDPNCPAIRNLIRQRCELYNEGTRKCVERGIRLGIIEGITWDDVIAFSGDGAWICIDTVLATFRLKKVPIPKDFRERVFKGEARAFFPAKAEAKEVIEAVRKADGIIALAHPDHKMHLYLNELIEYGLNGIETSHPDIPADVLPLALEAAETHRLYHCGGTDHSGPMSGCGGANAFPTFDGVTKEQFEILKERRLG